MRILPDGSIVTGWFDATRAEENGWILIDGPIADAVGGPPARFFRHRSEPLLLITVGGERIVLTKTAACDWQRAVGTIFAPPPACEIPHNLLNPPDPE